MVDREKVDNVNKKTKYIYIIAVIGILLDQIIKIIVRFGFGDSCSKCLSNLVISGGKFGCFNVRALKGIEIIPNFFYIINVKNTGGAWGVFSGNVMVLSFISILAIFMLYFFMKKEKSLNKLSITYYGFIFAGIIGNLIDRLSKGYVTDYLNFYIFKYDYPVFNLADILIVSGIFLMIIDVVRGEVSANQKRKRKN